MVFTKEEKLYAKLMHAVLSFISHIFSILYENHTFQKIGRNDAIAFFYQFLPYIK